MIPNFVFENIIKNDESHKKLYVKNILEGETHRKDREVFRALRKKGLLPATSPTHIEHIINYDNQYSWDYLKNKIIEEFKENHQNEPKKYPTNELTKYVDGIYDVFHDSFGRESYNNSNMIANVFMNFGELYNNAFWDGSNLCFGNGDGEYFNSFIIPDVIGHEFAHGVQDFESAFMYFDQSGALNEHVADVFGITFDQIVKGVDVNSSKWLIGEGIWTDRVNGVALRSMKDPGTAYNDNVVGTDPQPAHMDDYVVTTDDDNGVHINSGIPNKAFYLANIAKGGKIHENGIGQVWYNTILKQNGLTSNTNFQTFAQATVNNANNLDKNIIAKAWKDVGIFVDAPVEPPTEPPIDPKPPTEPPIDPLPPVEDKLDCPILNMIYKLNAALFRR
jgi:Zn-dependent metalloprotease